MTVIRTLLVAALASCATAIQAQAADTVAFVACPEFRPANGGCWTADYRGKTYALINPDNGLSPQLLHKVLVEGQIAKNASSACGGEVLARLWTSVLPEVSPECNTVLPALPGYAPPSNPITEELLGMLQLPLKAPPPPYDTKEVIIPFDFDGAFLAKKTQIPAELAVHYAIAAKAVEVVLEPSFGQTVLDSGEVMRERPEVANARVEVIRDAFVHFGYPAERIRVAAAPKDPRNGADARSLKVVIRTRR